VTSTLHWRLSRFYFFYYFFVGLFTPYWGLYLQDLKFNAVEIGALLSLFHFSRIIAPNFWGWLADHTGQRAKWIRLSSFLGVLGFCGVFWADTFYIMFFTMMAMSVFTSSTIPLAESLTLSHLSASKENNSYSRIRLWGSVGFITAAFLLGYLIDLFSIKTLVWALLLAQLTIFILTFYIPEKKEQIVYPVKRSILNVIKNREVIAMLLGSGLMVSSHGLLYNFYSIFLTDNNYSSFTIGALWSTGVIFEIFIFILMPKILKKINLKKILLVSLALAVLRFFLIGNFVDNIYIIIFAQILHAATFGSFHVASIQIIEYFFNKDHHARGQSIYNSLTYGVGGAVGGLGGGLMINAYGANLTFMLSALLPLLGFIVIYFGLKNYPDTIPAKSISALD
jgi:PPP family 3-phenylpropionic acid transporter|tara:strand:- start:724 stop:1908 length:1185 start_codon:yes stop_codon:yes gene_type:complete